MKLTLTQLTSRLEAICEVKEDIERRHDQLVAEAAELQEGMARLARIIPGCLDAPISANGRTK